VSFSGSGAAHIAQRAGRVQRVHFLFDVMRFLSLSLSKLHH